MIRSEAKAVQVYGATVRGPYLQDRTVTAATAFRMTSACDQINHDIAYISSPFSKDPYDASLHFTTRTSTTQTHSTLRTYINANATVFAAH